MTFLTTLALLAVVLAGAPYLAHRLRRLRAEEQPFPPTRLVDPAPPQARRRSRLEDRRLFVTRLAAVLVLVLLGATPMVRCSRLSVPRSGGASVAMAIVLDDSMSMRAKGHSTKSVFERARQGARELLASSREGDAVALVLAGAPARVALAATTDLGAARDALESLPETDRGTDLDGALALARGLLSSLPQVDRRIVLFSDLADGRVDASPLGQSSAIPIWVPMPELRAQGEDCAVMRADRSGVRVRVAIRCGPGGSAAGRAITVEDAQGAPLGHASAPPGSSAEATVLLPSDHASPARARLSGQDAIASDDVAPVIPEPARGAVAVVVDASGEAVATGGGPVSEQALAALKLDVDVRPIPAFPDRAEDLVGVRAVLLDDPPGLTPEQRHALGAYLEGGGVLLAALGPHAASAPLGASLEPVLSHALAWSETKATGADPATAVGELAESASSIADLGARYRTVLAPDDVGRFETLLKWTDGAPLLARRAVGRGAAWVLTLPLSLDASDLALRPAFLALLGAWEHESRERVAPKRTEVGTTWAFAGAHAVAIQGPAGPLGLSRDEHGVRFVPELLGSYRVDVDGSPEERLASPVESELDLRPRAIDSEVGARGGGQRLASVDLSGHLALLLLALVALEMGLRLWMPGDKFVGSGPG